MRNKPLLLGGVAALSCLTMAVPASALSVSLGGAGKAQTYYQRHQVEVTDTSTDACDVAVEYYRKKHPHKKRTVWVKTGSHTSNQSKYGSYIKKMRIHEDSWGSDRYSSWKS
ncbi:hypothetical protein [Streptomyces platensis]|uniref:hypothetical protein n=1 Tax=Streptomyces platensis TaxID=58346 RepID=UPI00378784E0